jgi:rare lipoprotein A
MIARNWGRALLITGLVAFLHVTGLPAEAKQPAKPVGCLSGPGAGCVKRVAHASWYGKSFQGRRTAAGSRFDLSRLTAAHRTLRFGSRVRVTELRTGRSVVVEITDRGPFLSGRDIDLSYAAARQLGIVERGVARVRLELIPPPTEPTAQPVATAMSNVAPWWLPKAIVQ